MRFSSRQTESSEFGENEDLLPGMDARFGGKKLYNSVRNRRVEERRDLRRHDGRTEDEEASSSEVGKDHARLEGDRGDVESSGIAKDSATERDATFGETTKVLAQSAKDPSSGQNLTLDSQIDKREAVAVGHNDSRVTGATRTDGCLTTNTDSTNTATKHTSSTRKFTSVQNSQSQHHVAGAKPPPPQGAQNERSQGPNGAEAPSGAIQSTIDGRQEERACLDAPRTKLSKTLHKQKKKSQRIHDLNATVVEGGVADSHLAATLRNSQNSTDPQIQGPSAISSDRNPPKSGGSGKTPQSQGSRKAVNTVNPQIQGSSEILNPTKSGGSSEPPQSQSSKEAAVSTGTPKIQSSSETYPPRSQDTKALGESKEQNWTQQQQRQLERALTQFPNFSKDRWLNVARSVPGKSQVCN